MKFAYFAMMKGELCIVPPGLCTIPSKVRIYTLLIIRTKKTGQPMGND